MAGVPKDSYQMSTYVSKRYAGLLKRMSRGSTANATLYADASADLEGERYEERATQYNKALGRVRRALDEAIERKAFGFEAVLSRNVMWTLGELRDKALTLD